MKRDGQSNCFTASHRYKWRHCQKPSLKGFVSSACLGEHLNLLPDSTAPELSNRRLYNRLSEKKTALYVAGTSVTIKVFYICILCIQCKISKF